MKIFQEALDECGLRDLGFVGSKFTWFKNYQNRGIVWERLDRAVATNEWVDLFPATKVHTLEVGSSDHKPILILPSGFVVKQNRPWRFEQMWLEDDGCHDTVAVAWSINPEGSPMFKVVEKINTCQKKLRGWSKKNFCNVSRTLSEKKKSMKAVEELAVQGGDVDFFLQLKEEVQTLLRQEEKMWQQHSHDHWMVSGDKNTSYFHNRASHKFWKNTISEIKDAAGVTQRGDDKIAAFLVDYYQQLFSSVGLNGIEDVVQLTGRCVTEDMNSALTADFSKVEVEVALKQMAPLKAPGPDRMPPIFFQHYWSSIGDDVVKAVLSCLNSSQILPGLNHTFLTLIPKVKCPKKATDFRPIALCNILYKFVSKVLANRLKRILPQLISESQSAFQSDKAISDNILMAFETPHHMKTKKFGKKGHLALKLDMRKAYDRIEWVFFEKIMLKMGFNSKWVGWILECIRSVTYSILVNGEPQGHIVPTRGIRQGNPLSPYLFLLCSEGLNRLIQQVVTEENIQGVSLCKNGPKISHLFFADDSHLFC